MVSLYIADISYLPDPKQEPNLLKELPEERLRKIEGQQQAEKRRQSLGAGLLLKRVLGLHGVSEDAIFAGQYGKPEAEGICFNLSHSGNIVACVVSEKPVGCDVEKLKTAPEGVATRFFCESENRHLQKFEGAEYDEEFFRLWTMKESYMKMTGEGMRLTLGAFEVLLDSRIFSENGVRVLRNGVVQSCVFHEYQVPGYKLTVCAEDAEFAELISVVL